MADEAHSGGGLVFHPMDQFIVKPLFGGDPIALVHHHQRDALAGARGPGDRRAAGAGTPSGAIVPSRSQSIAEVALWLHLQDGRGRGRQGRAQVLPLHHHAVHVHPVRQLPRPDPDDLHHHLAYRGDGVLALAVFLRSPSSASSRTAPAFLSLFWVSSRAAGAAPGPGDDRADFLLRAARQPLHSSGGQHHGRPRGHQGVRGLRRAWPLISPVADARRSPRSTGSRCWCPSSRPTSSPS